MDWFALLIGLCNCVALNFLLFSELLFMRCFVCLFVYWTLFVLLVIIYCLWFNSNVSWLLCYVCLLLRFWLFWFFGLLWYCDLLCILLIALSFDFGLVDLLWCFGGLFCCLGCLSVIAYCLCLFCLGFIGDWLVLTWLTLVLLFFLLVWCCL